MPKAGERTDYEEPRVEKLQDQLAEVEGERDDLLNIVRSEHKTKAAIGGSPCICKYCERE